MKNLFICHEKELKDLLRYGVLRAEELENPGLYNGKLGMIILFYEYSRYSGDGLYEQFADEIMDTVLELPESLSFHFSDGLTGIGWGIAYLLKEKFIEGDIDDILSEVDMKLKKIDTDDKNFEVDYSAYSAIKRIYMERNAGGYLSIPTYSEDNILEEIWKSCLC